jgi:cystathionine beta-synthase
MTTEIKNTVLDAVGNTPIVRLHKVAQGVKANVCAKLEYMNPGGSVKDRIGLAMIEKAEREGKLKPGGTIVEATSGNTGVGLAIAAAIKGYKSVFVMPDKMSEEKRAGLRAFGAKVIITPTAVQPEDPRSYYAVARKIAEETPNAILAGQYHNQANPEAHYRMTGPEIWRQTSGQIDVLVCGMGTGGTITGTGKYLKEQNPNVKVIGVDPIGSLLYDTFRLGHVPTEAFFKTYKIEGIGEDFLPTALDFQYVDDVVQVGDREAFIMTRRLVREEGIFCGGSSGTAVVGALKWVREHDLSPDATVVVILPDSGTRYLSKIFSDDWMRENRFLDTPFGQGTVGDVMQNKPNVVITASPKETKRAVIAKLKQFNISQVPVVDNGKYLGIVSEVSLLNHMLNEPEHNEHETIADIVNHAAATVTPDTSLESLTEAFAQGQIAIVLENGAVTGIVTKIDLIDYLGQKVK